MPSRRAAHLLLLPVFLACLAAALLAGCGTGTSGPGGHDTALVLDGPPDAVDAGIALATDRDYGSGNGLALTVRAPVAGGSGLQQVVDRRADFAVVDISELARPQSRRNDVVAVAAVVQLPYARPVRLRPGARRFRAPAAGRPYPQLVVVTTREFLDESAPVARSLVATLRRGYAEAIADPASAVAALTRQNPLLRTEPLTRQLAAISPAFTVGVPAWGAFSRADVAAWSRAQRPAVDPTLAFWSG